MVLGCANQHVMFLNLLVKDLINTSNLSMLDTSYAASKILVIFNLLSAYMKELPDIK